MRTMILCFCLAIAVTGCATPGQELTRDEWLSVTSRTYSGVTREEILGAAEKLFRLADGDDFIIVRTEDGMSAKRSWLAYKALAAVSGTDSWQLKVIPGDAGFKAVVRVSTQVQSSSAVPPASGAFAPYAASAPGLPIEGTAIYDLFWTRMDYLLGRRGDWMDCRMADERLRQGVVWGSDEALCSPFNMKDEKPPAPLVKNKGR